MLLAFFTGLWFAVEIESASFFGNELGSVMEINEEKLTAKLLIS